MTIYYNSQDHLKVMSQLKGTIWGQVLPFCIFCSLFYTGVHYFMPEFLDVTLPTVTGSHADSLTLLVSFLVVMRFDAEFGTFSEATAEFYHILGDCHLVAVNVRAFSAADQSPKANEWRKMMRVALIDFIRAACLSVQDDDWIMRIFEGELEDGDEDPLQLAETVHDIIIKHKDYLTNPETKLTIYHEMVLHEYTGRMLDEYVEVGKFKETPTPFPFVQVARTILYCYLLTLPIFISEDFNPMNVISMFFAVYGLFGLEVVSDEIGDPFGDDDNDIEINKMMKATIHHIRQQLDGDSAYYLRVLERDYGTATRPGLYQKPANHGQTEKSMRPVRFVKDTDDLSVANDEAEAYFSLGQDEKDMYNDVQALDYFKKALNCHPQPSLVCNILESMGDIYSRNNDHDKALGRYQEALRLKRKTKMMPLLSKIADSFFDTNELEKALSIYSQTLPLKTVEEGWDSDGVAQMYHRIGLIHFERGDTDLALDHLWHALRAKRRIGLAKNEETYWDALSHRLKTTNEEDTASVLFCMGLLHEERCEYDWALTYLVECSAIQRRQAVSHVNGLHPDISKTYLHIGSVHYRCNRIAEAHEAYRHSIRISKVYARKESQGPSQLDTLDGFPSKRKSTWREEAHKIWSIKQFVYPGLDLIYDEDMGCETSDEGNTSISDKEIVDEIESTASTSEEEKVEDDHESLMASAQSYFNSISDKKMPQTAPTVSESWSIVE